MRFTIGGLNGTLAIVHKGGGGGGGGSCDMLEEEVEWERRLRACTAVYEVIRHKCAHEAFPCVPSQDVDR